MDSANLRDLILRDNLAATQENPLSIPLLGISVGFNDSVFTIYELNLIAVHKNLRTAKAPNDRTERPPPTRAAADTKNL